jgi:formylglycine-generating enzyme required for sulfatase activity
MYGNLAEWCQDALQDYPGDPTAGPRIDVEDASPIMEHIPRMIRGGKYTDNAKHVRSADRSWYFPGTAFDRVGIRLARTLPPASDPPGVASPNP